MKNYNQLYLVNFFLLIAEENEILIMPLIYCYMEGGDTQSTTKGYWGAVGALSCVFMGLFMDKHQQPIRVSLGSRLRRQLGLQWSLGPALSTASTIEFFTMSKCR